MTAAAGAAAPAAADFLFELDALDWVVITAAVVACVVLVLELMRARAAAADQSTPPEGD